MVSNQSFFGRNFSLAISISWINILISSVIKILRVPIIVSALGSSTYGFWITLLGLSGLALTFEYVLTSTITREIAKKHVNNIQDRFNHFLSVKSSMVKIYYKFSIIYSLLVFISIYIVISITDVPVSSLKSFLCLVIVSLSVFIYIFSTIYIAILDGLDDVWVGKFTRLVYEISGFLILFIGLLIAKSIFILIASLIIQSLFFAILNYYLYKKRTKFYLVSERKNINIFSKLNKRILNISYMQSGSLLYLLAPTILIPTFFNYDVAAGYSLIAQLCQLGPYIVVPITSAYLPKLSHDVKNANLEFYFKLTFVVVSLVYTMYGIILANLQNLLFFWVGDGFYLGYLFSLIIILISMFEISYLVMRQIFICIDENKIFYNIATKAIMIYILIMFLCILIVNFYSNDVIYLVLPSLFTIFFVMNLDMAKEIMYRFKPKINQYILSLLLIITIISFNNQLKMLFNFVYYDLISTTVIISVFLIIIFLNIGKNGFHEIYNFLIGKNFTK